MHAMTSAHVLVLQMLKEHDLQSSLESGLDRSYRKLQGAFERMNFHCTLSVLDRMADLLPKDPIVRQIGRSFMGGCALDGGTCGVVLPRFSGQFPYAAKAA